MIEHSWESIWSRGLCGPISKIAHQTSSFVISFMRSAFISEVTLGWYPWKTYPNSLWWSYVDEYNCVKYFSATWSILRWPCCITPSSSWMELIMFLILFPFAIPWKYLVFLSPARSHITLLFLLPKDLFFQISLIQIFFSFMLQNTL